VPATRQSSALRCATICTAACTRRSKRRSRSAVSHTCRARSSGPTST
jgi:hypothetical protein